MEQKQKIVAHSYYKEVHIVINMFTLVLLYLFVYPCICFKWHIY